MAQFYAPPLSGLGQLYAGDYERARNIALWGFAIDWVGIMAMVPEMTAPPAELASLGADSNLTTGQQNALLAISALDASYAAWASWDAYHCAQPTPGPLVYQAPATRSSTGINPWLAAGAGSLTAGGLLVYASLHDNDPNAIAMSTAALGAGQYFAGDPMRGVLFSLGEPMLVLTGATIGAGLTKPTQSVLPSDNPQGAFWGVTALMVPYLAWVAYDAYRTAENE